MAKFIKGGGKPQLPRGATAPPPGGKLAARPPAVGKGGVANDFAPPKNRSAVMPPPTKDTQEPRMSRGSGRGLSKGRR